MHGISFSSYMQENVYIQKRNFILFIDDEHWNLKWYYYALQRIVSYERGKKIKKNKMTWTTNIFNLKRRGYIGLSRLSSL